MRELLEEDDTYPPSLPPSFPPSSVKKYILKSKERVWGELLEGEDDATVPLRPKQKAGQIKKEGEEEEQEEEGVEERARKMEKLLDEVFSKEKDCAALTKVLRQENINYQTEREQYR